MKKPNPYSPSDLKRHKDRFKKKATKLDTYNLQRQIDVLKIEIRHLKEQLKNCND